ncbi:MAG: monovalent cation/H(+) antiporter subunit G [Methyloligellaceae bacterium]
MAVALDILSAVLVIAGATFIVTGAIGLVRMPDVFSRMHAAGIIDSAGAGLLIAGMMIQAGLSLITLKLLVLLALFFFTSPAATHAVARAALHEGLEPVLDEAAQENDTKGAPK